MRLLQFRFVAVCVSASMLATIPALSRASILDPFGGIVRAEDDDAEGIISADGDTLLEDGEFLIAVAQFPQLGVVGGPPPTLYTNTTPMLTAISLIKVNGAPVLNTDGDRANYTFKAPTAAEWSTLTGLTVTGDSTMLLVYDDPASTPHITTTSIATAIATTSNGTLLYEFGTLSSTNFWRARTEVNDPMTGDPRNVLDVISDGSLSFVAALDLVKNWAGPQLEKHNYVSTTLGEVPSGFSPSTFASLAHIQLYGTNGAGLATSSELPLPTDATAYINVVPEPISAVVWLGISSLIAGIAVRSRRS